MVITEYLNIDSFKVESKTEIKEPESNFLTQMLNRETPNLPPVEHFEFYLRSPNEEIIAGSDGALEFGSLFIDQFWIHPDYRRRKLGSQFIEQIHDFGRQMGCRRATIQTFNFDGVKKFFDNHGYTPLYIEKGYNHEISCTYMSRLL